MDEFTARANINHFLKLLTQDDLDPRRRAVVIKLLTAEVDKLSHDPEQLDLALCSTGNGQDLLQRMRGIRDAFAPDAEGRGEAERLLATFQKTLESSRESARLKYLRYSL